MVKKKRKGRGEGEEIMNREKERWKQKRQEIEIGEKKRKLCDKGKRKGQRAKEEEEGTTTEGAPDSRTVCEYRKAELAGHEGRDRERERDAILRKEGKRGGGKAK